MLSATTLLGLVSFPVARLFGEPYPWLIMPGFEGTGGFDGRAVTLDEPLFELRYERGGARTLSVPELFADLPGSNLRTLAQRFGTTPRRLPRLAHLVPVSVFPGFRAATRSGVLASDPELLDWLGARVAREAPDARLSSVRVRWQRRMVDEDGNARLATLPGKLELAR